MIIDKLLGSSYVCVVSVFALIAGKQAVLQVSAVAHQWAAHINYFASWSN